MAEDAGAPRIAGLACTSSQGVADPVMRELAAALQPALSEPACASTLFVDHVTRAVMAHVAVRYGGMRAETRPTGGGLVPWQRRRAEALIDARLDGHVLISELAHACRLSASHFVHAFRVSMD
ncbi:MAG: hypothetical protein R2712_08590 [Vicinamibacterales bacterium]